MEQEINQEEEDAVYGRTYTEAEHQMELLEQRLNQQVDVGFPTKKECAEWAHENLLDIVAFSASHKTFFNVSHKGELISSGSFAEYYAHILYYMVQQPNGTMKPVTWLPDGFNYFNKAKLPGEINDGIHEPLYYRDYARPSGYFNKEKGCFNLAKPFPFFAKQTGRDTSHIYTLIEHVAGECAMWMLAWLRAKMVTPTLKTQVVPIIVSRTQGSGKGQPLTSKVLTFNGFKKLGDLKDGDLVVSPIDGMAYPVSIHNRGTRHINKVTMSNGAVTYCDDFHIWQARTVGEQSMHKPFHEMTIEDLKQRPLLKHYDTKTGSYDAKQIFIETVHQVQGTEYIKAAYAIGLFLGDGCYSNSNIYIDEEDVLEKFKESIAELGYTLSNKKDNTYSIVMDTALVSFKSYLDSLGLDKHSYDKFIPEVFKHAVIEDRIKLLEGLIDSDGCMTPGNNIDFSTSSLQLFNDIYDIASSLGFVVRKGAGKKAPKYQNGIGRPSYRLYFKYKDILHLSKKHMSKVKKVQHENQMAIVKIEDAGTAPCCCIYVDSPDHLYITDDWIVTHNTTIGEVICKGLFGKDNVLVTDQYDSQSRFNSDYADSLIVCMEEKEETDRRNTVSSIKSRATATTIRKELKGIDPIYQESYTDFLMTTNKDVPIKFDGREDQRRFMIMQADENFTRKTSPTADEVFSKLYGFDADGNKVGTPFVEDKELIEQFKYELYTREDIKQVKLRQFPKTAAYERCFSLPRTSENVEIESILRSLAPYIKESLMQNKMITDLDELGPISNIVQYQGALQFVPAFANKPKFIALCRPLVFYEMQSNKPYQHAVVERCMLDCKPWLRDEFGLDVIPDSNAIPGGFIGVQGRYKAAPATRICLVEDLTSTTKIMNIGIKHDEIIKKANDRTGERLRVNNMFRPDRNGCYETVNEMKIGVTTLRGNKSENVQYMDTFLFESDDCTNEQYEIEKKRAADWIETNEGLPIESTLLYKERLNLQKYEALRLFNEGTACRIVYSGAKSYHILVRVSDSPTTIEEYNWLHAYLCQSLSDKITFDISTSDPARLTRSPIKLERVTYNHNYNLSVHGTQDLICEDFSHIYCIQWRDMYKQWQERPLKYYEKKGKRLIPSKPEYKEAMEALINGTFWTDNTWDGRRQETFFPAYRLLCSLGYTHEELWTENMILKNLDSYAKTEEIGYWKSRESSNIVKQIEKDFENDTTEK